MSRTTNGDFRQKILDAAEHRLWHYGFKKTTIDEIAADAGVGKGTVYLHFDSKEDIALEIVMQFKQISLSEQQQIAQDDEVDLVSRLKMILTHPAVMAYRRCVQSPSAQEMVIAVRPHIQSHIHPYQELEIALIASLLEEGNKAGMFAVPRTDPAARTLKSMCAGFMPPYPRVEGEEDIRAQIGAIVDLAFFGLRGPSATAGLSSHHAADEFAMGLDKEHKIGEEHRHAA